MEEGWGLGALPVPGVKVVAAVSSIFKKEVLAYTDSTHTEDSCQKKTFWTLTESS